MSMDMDFIVCKQIMPCIASMCILKFDGCTIFIISVTGQLNVISVVKYDDMK